MQDTRCEAIGFIRDNRYVLKNVSLEIRPGKITGIMGPSGCGKTTILRLLVGLLQPAEGQVFLFGQNLWKVNQSKLYELRHRIGFLFQNAALFTDMTVFDNVAFPLREKTKLSSAEIKEIVLAKLQAVGLKGAANRYPNELSGGMSRRVALARAIALDPELLFYDEPFTGQDPITKGVLVKLIKTVNAEFKSTTVLVSHDVPETLALADYVYIIANGSIIAEGTPEELKTHEQNSLVAQFLSGTPDGQIPFHVTTEDSV